MFYLLSWFAVALLLALWSLAVWALHDVSVWLVSASGGLTGVASSVGGQVLPDWLAPWVPTEMTQAVTQLMSALGTTLVSLLQAMPALSGGVTIAAWVIWGIGSAFLLALGVGLHLLIALWRRNSVSAAPQRPGPSPVAG